jgi:hypothetical protein
VTDHGWVALLDLLVVRPEEFEAMTPNWLRKALTAVEQT